MITFLLTLVACFNLSQHYVTDGPFFPANKEPRSLIGYIGGHTHGHYTNNIEVRFSIFLYPISQGGFKNVNIRVFSGITKSKSIRKPG